MKYVIQQSFPIGIADTHMGFLGDFLANGTGGHVRKRKFSRTGFKRVTQLSEAKAERSEAKRSEANVTFAHVYFTDVKS